MEPLEQPKPHTHPPLELNQYELWLSEWGGVIIFVIFMFTGLVAIKNIRAMQREQNAQLIAIEGIRAALERIAGQLEKNDRP